MTEPITHDPDAQLRQPPTASPPRWMRVRDVACVLFFAVFWLAPILSEGVVREPLHGWLPENCHDQYRIACLFPDQHEFALEFYVQGVADDGKWFTLRDEEYTPMRPFGYYNRNWALLHSFNNRAVRLHWLRRQPRTPEILEQIEAAQEEAEEYRVPAEELTDWYRERHASLHPEAPGLMGVRVLAAWHPVGSEIATPAGHWLRQAVEDIPRDRILVVLMRGFEAK
jgi:hypothetical protein